MRRPSFVRIGLQRYRVSWSRDAITEIAGEDVDAAGATAPAAAWIAVEPLPAAPILEREVLLHEVLHAAVAASSVHFDDDDEEAFVAAVAPRLLEALRQTPALVRYLTEPV